MKNLVLAGAGSAEEGLKAPSDAGITEEEPAVSEELKAQRRKCVSLTSSLSSSARARQYASA